MTSTADHDGAGSGPAEGAGRQVDAAPVRAVVFDLDDTLFLQSEWLRGAWAAVAVEASRRYGVGTDIFEERLAAIAAEGSDKGRIIDRALEDLGVEADPAPLVDAFRSFRPGSLELLPGVREMLGELRLRIPLGLVSDGDPGIQEAKLRLLGIEGLFDAVVLSDLLGRQFRKPHPAPFRQVLARLDVAPADAVYIGDRPDKDVVGARQAGIRVIRVKTGEYADLPSVPEPWAEASDVLSAVEWVSPLLPRDPGRVP